MADFHTAHEHQVREELVRKAELLKKRSDRTWRANFGMIASLGGVIIVPILLGLFAGSYLDKALPQRFSWQLSLLFVGFVWGFFNAYLWIKTENDKIEKIGRDKDDR